MNTKLKLIIVIVLSTSLFITVSTSFGGDHDDKINELHNELKKLSPASQDYLSARLEIYKELLILEPENTTYKYYISKYEKEIDDKKSNKAEKDILKEIETIPESDFQKKFFLYSRLVNLNKKNNDYKAKYEFYKDKYDKFTDQYIDEVASKLKELENDLLVPKGNEFAQMAVKYMGRGNFYVRIVNVSNQPFHVNPNHFTLVGRNLRSYHYKKSDGIMVDLQPGTITEGYISFDSYSEPKELIYSNPFVGRISRVFN